jgi:hypothetical protein
MTAIARVAALILLASIPVKIGAQTTTETPVNFAVWGTYDGDHPIRPDSPWRLLAQATSKRNNGVAIAQAYLLEGGLGYEFGGGQQVAGGYTFQYHYPYDSASQPYKWPEQRIWQEANLRTTLGKGNKKFKQRFRIEERWLARKSPPDFDEVTSHKFEVRFRYKAGVELPLSARTYAIFNDEIFLRLLPRNEKWLDQNRLFAGVGFALDNEKLERIEVGYMLQTFRHSADTSVGLKRINNTIRITFKSAAPLWFK